ncbi:hypothetical protein ACFV5G_09485 [Streptomyces sp. NPDC059766]|uniref:hypothetical protein n=1 Tax=Streptomyces sp. NPDC059766 TaxID=3346940 RepID=UPI003649E297
MTSRRDTDRRGIDIGIRRRRERPLCRHLQRRATAVMPRADRGFSSERNRRYLRQGNNAYIVGEKLRCGSPEVKAALSHQGRYGEIAQNMRVKEVRISDTERFVICHNPEAAARDQHIREQLVSKLTTLIEDTDKLSDFKRVELRGKIADKPDLNCYLRTTPSGNSASTPRRARPRRTSTASTCCEAPARTCPPRTSRSDTNSSSKSSGAGGT